MIAVDSNLLVYSHRRDSPWHDQAREVLRELAAGPRSWAIPWSCMHEFLGIVTHPRIYNPPSTVAQALAQVDAWLGSPRLVTLAEGPGYWEKLRELTTAGRIAGPLIHDARIAALCLIHGVQELWTADRDFSRFPMLVTRNPMVG